MPDVIPASSAVPMVPSATSTSATTMRRTVSDQLAPLTVLRAQLTASWQPTFDVPHARARLASGATAFDALDVLGTAVGLLAAYVRATHAVEHAGLATEDEGALARDRRYQLQLLMAAWVSGEPLPRDGGKGAARRAAALVAGSVLSRASRIVCGDDAPSFGGAVTAVVDGARATCPCCGNVPDFAFRGVVGERLLLCCRCDTSWATPAAGCLGCGAHEAPTIARIASPAIGYQLTICNACGRYLKEPLDPVVPDPLIERALTSELDAAAEARGLRL